MPPGVIGYIDEQISILRRLLPEAVSGGEKATHELRVATRRLGAALALLEGLVDAKVHGRLRQTARQLRRSVGKLRDVDVMLEGLAEITDVKAVEAVAWLRGRLQAQRADLLDEAPKAANVAKVQRRLMSWGMARLEMADHLPEVHARVIDGLLAVWDQFASCADAVAAQTPGADPHELRILGKRLRYVLEIASADHETKHTRELAKHLKSIHKTLGTWHDHVVLAQTAIQAAADAELVLHQPRTLAVVLKLAGEQSRRAALELTRCLKLWASEKSALGHAIAKLAEKATGSKTDPDPAATQGTSAQAAPPPGETPAA